MNKTVKVFSCFQMILTFSLVLSGVSFGQDNCTPVGWATQNGGVTGGGNATPTVVANYNDLKSALTSASVKMVHINGTISVPASGRITIQDLSDKTIIGLPGSKIVSTDLTSGGSGILYIKRCDNLILRNMIFEGPGAYDVDGSDNLCVDNCRNVWVDHCEFYDGVDGNFDIKNMADFISVTWCIFAYNKSPIAGGSGGSNDHRYSNLIGSSDNATDDDGHLNVTFNFCWWGEGCKERMPRMRFGKLHMVNNLFSSSVANNCIRAGYKANILAVGNYFDNQNLPIDEFNNDYTAIKAYDNYGAGTLTRNTAFTPPYTLEAIAAQDIVTPIKTCAGATLPGPDGCSGCGEAMNKNPVVTITGPADNSAYDAAATIEITVDASDEDGSIANVEFYNETTLIGTSTSSPYSFTWKDVAAGTYSITASATDDEGGTGTSSPVTIIVNDPSLPSLIASSDTIQVVDSGNEIIPVVFTWGGAATDVTVSSLPEGLTANKNSSDKTLTISGAPAEAGSFTVTTVGGDSEVSRSASIIIKVPGQVLADWYAFQDEEITLPFVSFSDASVETDFFDQEKPDNGIDYSTGALRLNKGTGTMTLTMLSLDVLKFRWYATGMRTLKVTYGPTGNENTWTSSSEYESGAHEFDLTTMLPELVSEAPVIVHIINNRSDGGSFNIHDLYVEGTAQSTASLKQPGDVLQRKENKSFSVSSDRIMFTGNNSNTIPVYVFALSGKTVLRERCRNVLDIRRLRSGVYLFKTGTYSMKFLKK